VIKNVTVNRVSFNGPGGIEAKPTAEEQAAANEQHLEATQEQRAHREAAIHDSNQRFSVNKGNPAKTAVTKAGAREEVNRAATPTQERKEATKEQATKEQKTSEETTKARTTKQETTKGNEPGVRGREETTKGTEQKTGEEVKGKGAATPERREEKPKAEGQPKAEAQKEHHEAGTKPAEEKPKAEKEKGEKKEKEQKPQ
jgi:hypothetical protein